MNNKDWKRHFAYEALVILGLLALLTFICRLWPILLLVILGIFVAAIRLLFLASRRIETVEPQPIPQEPVREPTEKDVRALAYAVILRRITELVTEEYPQARWVWEIPDAKQEIEKGGDVYILLNRAGGYRRARVILQNLQVVRIDYHPSDPMGNTDPEPVDDTAAGSEEFDEDDVSENGEPDDGESADDEEPVKENYGLIAFEWVEAHILELNERCNESMGQGFTELILISEELPVQESWPDICHELCRAGLADVQPVPDGIKINLSSDTAERE